MKINQISTLQEELNALKMASFDAPVQNTIAFTSSVAWMEAGSSNINFTAWTGIGPIQAVIVVVHTTGTVTVSGLSNLLNAGTITKYSDYYIIKAFNVSKTATPSYAVSDYFGGGTSTGGIIQKVNDTWGAVNIINGNTTPLQLVTAPGDDLVWDLTSGYAIAKWGSGAVAYTTNVNLEVLVGATVVGTCTAILSATSHAKIPFVFNNNVPDTNAAITLRVATGDPQAGNFDIEYCFYYAEKAAFAIPIYTSPPQAPTEVYAEVTGRTTSTVYWTAPASGDAPTSYRVDASINGGAFSTVAADTGNTNTSYNHTGITAGDKVKYKIYGINAGGTGAASADSTEYGLTTPFGATTSLQARRAQHIEVKAGSIINNLSIYITAGTTSNAYLALYDDENGLPGRLLGVTASFATGVVTAEWVTENLLEPVHISYDQKVWVAYVFETAVTGFYETVTTDEGRAAAGGSNLYAAGMPERFDANGTSTLGTARYNVKVGIEKAIITPITDYNFNDATFDTNEATLVNVSSANMIFETTSTKFFRVRSLGSTSTTAWQDYIRSLTTVSGECSVSADFLSYTGTTGGMNVHMSIFVDTNNYASIYRHDNGEALMMIKAGGSTVYPVTYSGYQMFGNKWKIDRDASNRFRFYVYNETTRVWDELDAATDKTHNIGTNVYGQITPWMSNGALNVSGNNMLFDNFRFDPFRYKTKYPRPHLITSDDFLTMQPWANSAYPDNWGALSGASGTNLFEEDATYGMHVLSDANNLEITRYGNANGGLEDIYTNRWYKVRVVVPQYTSGTVILYGLGTSLSLNAAKTYLNLINTSTWGYHKLRSPGASEMMIRSLESWED